jgi:hypothetical protein
VTGDPLALALARATGLAREGFETCSLKLHPRDALLRSGRRPRRFPRHARGVAIDLSCFSLHPRDALLRSGRRPRRFPRRTRGVAIDLGRFQAVERSTQRETTYNHRSGQLAEATTPK